MGLVIPGVGTEIGPDWALELNGDLSKLDSHNHSAGQGVQIQPNGININADLAFNSNNATLLRSSNYAPQSVVLALPTDIGCVYVVNNELYYNDVTGGNKVQITNNGSVNAGAGSIGGLPSGTASATYAAGVFTFQSATSTPANIDAGSYVYRNTVANSKGLTLQPPAAMVVDSVVTLPTIPVSQSFLTIDAAGNIAPYASINQGITRNNLVSVGQQISTDSGAFSTVSLVPAFVTGSLVTITTSGRPVVVFCQPAASNDSGNFNATGVATASWQIARGGFGPLVTVGVSGAASLPCSSLYYMDTPIAGTYSYAIQSFVSAGSTANTTNVVLVAYEL
jgi:hypothetical protein